LTPPRRGVSKIRDSVLVLDTIYVQAAALAPWQSDRTAHVGRRPHVGRVRGVSPSESTLHTISNDQSSYARMPCSHASVQARVCAPLSLWAQPACGAAMPLPPRARSNYESSKCAAFARVVAAFVAGALTLACARRSPSGQHRAAPWPLTARPTACSSPSKTPCRPDSRARPWRLPRSRSPSSRPSS
jgi:hypothetical protein